MDNARDLRRFVWRQSSARLAVCIFGDVPRSGFLDRVRSVGFFPYGVFLMPRPMIAAVVAMVGGGRCGRARKLWPLDELPHGG